MKLHNHINAQAKAVKAYLEYMSEIEASWHTIHKYYAAEPYIAEWYNGREEGYVVYLTVNSKSICFVFAEHRNSDGIVLYQWEADRGWFNPPALVDFSDETYQNKKEFPVGFAYEVANKIHYEMRKFWAFHSKED